MHHLARRVKAHYAGSSASATGRSSTSSGTTANAASCHEPEVEAVVREINGYEVATGRPLSSFTELRDDGSTASGVWIYCGVYADGVNQARRREPGEIESEGGAVSPDWAWAWPANRRILYNRASADPAGGPWSERKRYVWWDTSEGKWTGYDVPDSPPTKAPTTDR